MLLVDCFGRHFEPEIPRAALRGSGPQATVSTWGRLSMHRFEPCQGKDACRDDGERCLTCGRSLSEIARLRAAIDELAALALDAGYESTEGFARYVSRMLFKTINHRREQAP